MSPRTHEYSFQFPCRECGSLVEVEGEIEDLSNDISDLVDCSDCGEAYEVDLSV